MLGFKTKEREMVQWWKSKEACQAKVTEDKDGSYIMWMEGEKYPFPGYPRGHLIVNTKDSFSSFSRLKHEIKSKLFNENWFRLDRGEPLEIDSALKNIYELAYEFRYDMMPFEKCAPAVREIAKNLSHPQWKAILQAIFQEDDAYRWRFQWIVPYLDKKDPIGSFDKAMDMLEHAEVLEDMKDRVRLIRRVLLALWEDPKLASYWIEFVQGLDFNKAQLTKADKFYFRAKYFKVDFPEYEY